MHLKKKIIDDELKKLILKPLYEKREEEKRKNLINLLKKTLIYNYNNCKKYKNICEYFNFNPKKPFNLDEIPYLTSYVFKNNILSSISKSKIFRQINSSSTTSDKFSRITLSFLVMDYFVIYNYFSKLWTNFYSLENYQNTILLFFLIL